MTNADIKEFRLRLDAIERGQKDLANAMNALCEAMSGKRGIEEASDAAVAAYARLYVRQHDLMNYKPKTTRSQHAAA